MSELIRNADDFIMASRSAYQIAHFVLGQHDTQEMQYKQLLVEARELMYNLKSAEISSKKLEVEIARLEASDDELDHLEAQQKRLDLGKNMAGIIATKKELDVFEEIFSQIPHFTDSEIEENQKDYWEKRLARQAEMDVESTKTGISAGNLNALLQANVIQRQVEK